MQNTTQYTNSKGLSLTGKRCQCGACEQYFNSMTGFEAHRVGSFTPDKRRCLTVTEISGLGYIKNQDGFWIMPISEEKREVMKKAWGK